MSSRVLNSIILVSLALFMLRSGTPRMEEAVSVTGAAYHAALANPLSTVHCASSGHSMHSGFTHDDRDAAIARPLDPLDAGIPQYCAQPNRHTVRPAVIPASRRHAHLKPERLVLLQRFSRAGTNIALHADNPSRFHLRI